MAKWLRALTTVPENPGSVPSTYRAIPQPSAAYVLKDLIPIYVDIASTWCTDTEAGKTAIHIKQ